MTVTEVVATAFALSMDAFSVALAASAAGYASDRRAIFRLSFHFGLFQALLPVAGWALGMQADELVRSADHWIAFALLVLVGGRMIRNALDGSEAAAAGNKGDPSRGPLLVLLSLAVSVDALAIGFSLAMLRVKIVFPSITIGLVTGAMALVGIIIGRRVGQLLGKRMELIGGCLLVLLGLRIVITHQVQ